jgi:hypothetical protein
MRRGAAQLFLLSITFILVMQLFTPVQAAAQGNGRGNGQGRNRKYSMRIDPDSQPGQRRRQRRRAERMMQRGNWCYRGCRRQYAQCLNFAGGNQGRRRACAIRYRNCIRRCA